MNLWKPFLFLNISAWYVHFSDGRSLDMAQTSLQHTASEYEMTGSPKHSRIEAHTSCGEMMPQLRPW
jgi:hypothetical protein